MKIFHGGCLGCINQAIKGIGYCDGCQYRRADWSLPSLYRDNDDLLELKKLYEDIFIKKNNDSNQLEPPVILPKANPTCENCKYWQDVSNGWGYCKFNPPYIKKEQRYRYYYQTNTYDPNLMEDICHKEWVHTDKNDWCGQFEQREP